jgi:hypothetical protein
MRSRRKPRPLFSILTTWIFPIWLVLATWVPPSDGPALVLDGAADSGPGWRDGVAVSRDQVQVIALAGAGDPGLDAAHSSTPWSGGCPPPPG